MNPFADPSPARLMVRLSSPGAGSFAAGQYDSGVFIRGHRSPFSASRSASDCLCRSLAAQVNTLRKKVLRASVAHSVSRFDVLSMTALSQAPNWGFKRVASEIYL